MVAFLRGQSRRRRVRWHDRVVQHASGVSRLATGLAVAGCLTFGITGCGSDAPDTAPESTTSTTVAAVPNLVGTFRGEYEFPYKGSVVKTSLDLVIERQEGDTLFGYERFVNSSGEIIRFDLAGTANVDPVSNEVRAVLVTTGFFFDIEVIDADHLGARFVKTDDKPTTFFVHLVRQK